MCRLLEAGEHRGTIEVAPSWAADAAMWFRLPQATSDARTWAMLLVPDRVDPSLRFPDSSIHVYQALEWLAPAPRAPVAARVATRWVRRKGSGIELAVETAASAGGTVVARSTTVARVDRAEVADVDEFGEGCVPAPPPVPATTTQGKRLVIGEGDLAEFARLTGDSHPLHADHAFAHRSGYPNLLVQGHVQVLTVMSLAGVARRGAVDAWFRHPIAAGAALVAAAAPCDGGEIWTLRAQVDDAPATIVRITS